MDIVYRVGGDGYYCALFAERSSAERVAEILTALRESTTSLRLLLLQIGHQLHDRIGEFHRTDAVFPLLRWTPRLHGLAQHRNASFDAFLIHPTVLSYTVTACAPTAVIHA